MKKKNIIDPTNRPDFTEEKPLSEELQKAIQNLIYRLRELGPLSN